MYKRFENNKGITLIALVITIIILLILAGITMATIRREKWFNIKSKSGKRNTNKSRNERTININIK